MANSSKPEVQVFAGIDVSARELSVAVRCGTEDREAVTTFRNNAAGHKALLAYLLRGNGRARVCLGRARVDDRWATVSPYSPCCFQE